MKKKKKTTVLKKHKKESSSGQEQRSNASPVCYAQIPDLREEYKERKKGKDTGDVSH